MPDSLLLAGKVALITGAADGIGLAIAGRFASAGAQLALADINIEKLESEARRLREGGADVLTAQCDVSVTGDVDAFVARVLDTYRRVDVLVNNAAVGLGGNIMDMPEEDWNRVLNVNLTSCYRTIRTVLPRMLDQGSGSVIGISSTQAHRSFANWTAYAAAKGGMVAMTRQLAGQFSAQNVRFNTISPGAVNTPMNARRVEQEGEGLLREWARMHAVGRIAEPEEIASAALFLASDESGFITGQDLIVDGGLTVLPRYIELS